MTSSIDLYEAISTQRAIRQFKPDPVPNEMISPPAQGGRQGPVRGRPPGLVIHRDTRSGDQGPHRRTVQGPSAS